jgi:hypothetical protein
VGLGSVHGTSSALERLKTRARSLSDHVVDQLLGLTARLFDLADAARVPMGLEIIATGLSTSLSNLNSTSIAYQPVLPAAGP